MVAQSSWKVWAELNGVEHFCPIWRGMSHVLFRNFNEHGYLHFARIAARMLHSFFVKVYTVWKKSLCTDLKAKATFASSAMSCVKYFWDHPRLFSLRLTISTLTWKCLLGFCACLNSIFKFSRYTLYLSSEKTLTHFLLDTTFFPPTTVANVALILMQGVAKSLGNSQTSGCLQVKKWKKNESNRKNGISIVRNDSLNCDRNKFV